MDGLQTILALGFVCLLDYVGSELCCTAEWSEARTDYGQCIDRTRSISDVVCDVVSSGRGCSSVL